MPFLTSKNHTIYFLFCVPFIGTFLLIEKIILFLSLLKLLYPLAFLIIVFILELTPSIALFDNRLPSILIKEFIISTFQLLSSLPKFLNSSRCELLNSYVNSFNSSSHVSCSAVKLNSRYFSFKRYAYLRSSSILSKYFKISPFLHFACIL